MLLQLKQKDRFFNKFLAKRVSQEDNSLVFEIDSKISKIKNGETKIYNTVQELQSLVKQSNGKDILRVHSTY